MNDNIFLDSNVVIYSYSNSEPQKQEIAQRLIAEHSFISTQVLQELSNTVTRKFKFSYSQAIAAIQECCHNNHLHINTDDTILSACKLAEKYGYSFYDSLIIAAAIESGCNILYTEDMHDQQVIEGKLLIKNPFK